LAASGTALATGLGAVPVFYLSDRAAQLTPLLGFAAGVTRQPRKAPARVA
jgi:hypothetical protein